MFSGSVSSSSVSLHAELSPLSESSPMEINFRSRWMKSKENDGTPNDKNKQ